IAIAYAASRRKARWQASTSQMPPRSRCIGRASKRKAESERAADPILSVSENAVGAAAQSVVVWAEIMEIRHAARIIQRRRGVGAIEPPVIARVAVESLRLAEVSLAPSIYRLRTGRSET